ncbi:MAG: hypothetical protein EOO89_23505 [Pedobacter sp.]|nr:MAG: hypothetical protein EOO89_23505 [Pedobacter sp.]
MTYLEDNETMGTSYVGFIDKGYWTNDAFLEGFSYLLAREFKKINNKEHWQIDMIENWITATVGFVGCVPSYFKLFDSHDKIQVLRNTLLNILSQLRSNPMYITVSELNEHNIGQRVWQNPSVDSFINITQLTLKLIDGELNTDASSPIDYWDVQ